MATTSFRGGLLPATLAPLLTTGMDASEILQDTGVLGYLVPLAVFALGWITAEWRLIDSRLRKMGERVAKLEGKKSCDDDK